MATGLTTGGQKRNIGDVTGHVNSQLPMTYVYNRAPSQSLCTENKGISEIKAIKAGGRCYNTVNVLLNQHLYKENRDFLIAAFVPEENRYTADVYPFVRPSEHYEIPQTLVDLQQLMLSNLRPLLQSHVRSQMTKWKNEELDATIHAAEAIQDIKVRTDTLRGLKVEREQQKKAQHEKLMGEYHPVWILLSSHRSGLKQELLSCRGNAIQCMLQMSQPRAYNNILCRWEQFVNQIRAGQFKTKRTECLQRTYSFQRELHAVATWGRGLPATRRGNFTAEATARNSKTGKKKAPLVEPVHRSNPYQLYVPSANESVASGLMPGDLTVILEVAAVHVPDRKYSSAQPMGLIEPDHEKRNWACAYVRELCKEDVVIAHPYEQVVHLLQQIKDKHIDSPMQ